MDRGLLRRTPGLTLGLVGVLLAVGPLAGCRVHFGRPAPTPTGTPVPPTATVIVASPTIASVPSRVPPAPTAVTASPTRPAATATSRAATATPPRATTTAAGPTAPSGSRVLYRDDFKNPDSGFPAQSRQPDLYRSGYANGEYEITLFSGSGRQDTSNWAAALSNRTFDDLSLELDCRIVDEKRDGAYAILFRVRDMDNYYKFIVDPIKGMYSLNKVVGNRQTVLADWAKAGNIKRGTDNTLRVVAKGKQIAAYINGVRLVNVSDDSFSTGVIGMMINAWSDPFTARFANLVVASPE